MNHVRLPELAMGIGMGHSRAASSQSDRLG